MQIKKWLIVLIILWLFALTLTGIKNSKTFYQDAYSVRFTNVNWNVIENGSGEDIKELKVKVKKHQVYVQITLWNNKTVERTYERNKLIYIDYM